MVDRLEGTIKRAVWRHIRSGRGFASTPEQFFELARDRNPGITISYITDQTVSKAKEEIEAHWSATYQSQIRIVRILFNLTDRFI